MTTKWVLQGVTFDLNPTWSAGKAADTGWKGNPVRYEHNVLGGTSTYIQMDGRGSRKRRITAIFLTAAKVDTLRGYHENGTVLSGSDHNGTSFSCIISEFDCTYAPTSSNFNRQEVTLELTER